MSRAWPFLDSMQSIRSSTVARTLPEVPSSERELKITFSLIFDGLASRPVNCIPIREAFPQGYQSTAFLRREYIVITTFFFSQDYSILLRFALPMILGFESNWESTVGSGLSLRMKRGDSHSISKVEPETD